MLVLGALGIYDGLKDRTLENQRIAQEHYALGVAHLEAGEYELAIGEFKLALRHDANLREARSQLLDAEELARAQATPTSETRRDAAELLYRQAVAHYEGGNLEQAVAVLDELRGPRRRLSAGQRGDDAGHGPLPTGPECRDAGSHGRGGRPL